tara:strand:- start:586 stop:756 length:171 start_codon:yes stop_codon:yes gene_type:complete
MVIRELIEILDRYYPDKLPMADLNSNQLAFLQGQRSVIERIKQIHEDEDGRISEHA